MWTSPLYMAAFEQKGMEDDRIRVANFDRIERVENAQNRFIKIRSSYGVVTISILNIKEDLSERQIDWSDAVRKFAVVKSRNNLI